jgi:hypothetical protein
MQYSWILKMLKYLSISKIKKLKFGMKFSYNKNGGML